jgi:hypothetical protein
MKFFLASPGSLFGVAALSVAGASSALKPLLCVSALSWALLVSSVSKRSLLTFLF